MDLSTVAAGTGLLDLAGAGAVARQAFDFAGRAATAAALHDDVAGPTGATGAAAVTRVVIATVAVDGDSLEAPGLAGVVAALGTLGHFGGFGV